MARRNFARPHRLHVLNELNVTPLLDLCFCLLIIFMIATPVLEQTAPVELPPMGKDAGAPKPADPKPVIVSFNSAGELLLGGRVISERDLREEFRRVAALPKESQPSVRIRGDRRASYEMFAKVYDIARSARLTRLGIDSEVK